MKPLQRKDQERIAHRRIRRLFELADAAKEDALAQRYASLARKISTRYRIRIPKEMKRRLCKHCNAFLVPGKNVRIRVRDGKIVYYCLQCKKFMRYVVKE